MRSASDWQCRHTSLASTTPRRMTRKQHPLLKQYHKTGGGRKRPRSNLGTIEQVARMEQHSSPRKYPSNYTFTNSQHGGRIAKLGVYHPSCTKERERHWWFIHMIDQGRRRWEVWCTDEVCEESSTERALSTRMLSDFSARSFTSF